MAGNQKIINRLRLISGLVLFTFLSTHLINLGLGLFSYQLLDAGRDVFIAIWRSIPGTVVLLTAFLVHLWLGLWKIFRLSSLHMPFWELFQVLLGLLLPIMVAPHIVGSRISHEVLGLDDNYAWELLILWSWIGGLQNLLVLAAWMHGAMGIHYWLRFRPFYRRLMPVLLGLSVTLPLWAFTGFISAGREVQRLASTPGWLADLAEKSNWPPPDYFPTLRFYSFGSAGLVFAFIVLMLGIRQLLVWRRKSRDTATVFFGSGREAPVFPGMSVLEVARAAGIPHASVCGGRARCSTCRVRLGDGGEALPPPGEGEQAVLRRIGAPPGVRLACQIRPMADLKVTPLLPPHIQPQHALAKNLYQYGREMEIAILFTDLRGFTTMTEKGLPYDVVFLMNRYFHAMGEIIEAHRGHLVQVFGDGIMALFGIGEGPEPGCRRALRVAKEMAARLEQLNADHPLDMATPLRMGIGIHSGPVIVGEMGYRDAIILTAVGDAVNTTSRVQEATKDFGVQLVVSIEACTHSGLDFSSFPAHQMEVRGRTQSLDVRTVESALNLPEHTETPPGNL